MFFLFARIVRRLRGDNGAEAQSSSKCQRRREARRARRRNNGCCAPRQIDSSDTCYSRQDAACYSAPPRRRGCCGRQVAERSKKQVAYAPRDHAPLDAPPSYAEASKA
ncbi:hypothetical protein AAL_01672 [Moelleriella libera RCEF 2490]|uniref:Uncharacterized protein n=1 Tax=Moelleriella libera RCEF 2490 TaxID=1081109 RepID=A0A166UCB8_9HYPO|nr:hypothetical protein AAL_01672 [Moelleriella libera RCEF 2490]